MGGWYNSHKNFIESFLLGAVNQKAPNEYEVFSVGKVANVIAQRVVLCERLKPYWHDMNNEPPPLWYHYVHNSLDGRPDLWIDPKNSEILQIKAADLAPSGQFKSSKALHFPRIEFWRNDKLWNECLSMETFESMCKGARGVKKITSRELVMEDITTDRQRKLTAAQKRNLGLKAYEKQQKIEKVLLTVLYLLYYFLTEFVFIG